MMPGQGWYRIEAHFIGGSCNTCYDGRVRWWITPPGGTPQLQGDYPNFAYTTTFKEFAWSETWDGFGNGTVPAGYTSNQYHEIDHIRISSTDCANNSCFQPGVNPSPPPSTPPPPPTGPVDSPVGAPTPPVGLGVTRNGYLGYEEFAQFNELITE
jgi:hypothetical protein